jgi:molecular chaperone GrpE
MTDEQTKPETKTAPDAAPEVDAEIAPELSETDLLRLEVRELKERVLRSQAEFDNVRKRLRREADEAGGRAVARFCKPVLDQIDNLTRALNAANPATFADFAMGVTLTREGLLSALAGQGIEQVVSEGIFDPAVHEVIAETEKPDVPRGTILSVNRAGFRFKEQLVRAAQVVVAK